MRAVPAVLLGAAGVAAAFDWIAVAGGLRSLERAAKPATLLLLLGVAATLEPTAARERGWFVLALALCLLGDVLLLPQVDSFAAGLAAFLVGHLAFIAGLVARGDRTLLVGLIALAAALNVARIVGGRVVRALFEQRRQNLVAPVIAYMLVLSLMTAAAWAAPGYLAGAGAALFMLSDAVIAWTRFVNPLRGGRLAIAISYHLAVALLVLSLLS